MIEFIAGIIVGALIAAIGFYVFSTITGFFET